MSYLVISRRWRPQKFDEIAGQEHITKVLENAIRLNRVSHAYIFSGPRGVGKTTTARVFAKALNCKDGPTPAPCLKCVQCQEISKGISLDVLEIDGASNRGIEQVRDLRENIKLKPIQSRYKIYIIDEVHMLTEQAFNALLKTLEEPPEHVKFIFATTQLQKVPLTILSRCQKFEFRPLAQNIIEEKLFQILNSEEKKYSLEAVRAIAQSAEGSLRDAESLLDQLICISQNSILSLELVNQFLGTIEQDALHRISQSLIDSDERGALLELGRLISEGKEVFQILSNLISYFRKLMLMKIFNSGQAPDYIMPEISERLKEQAYQLSKEEILLILEILSELEDKLKEAVYPRVLLEIGFLKICNRAKIQILNYQTHLSKEENVEKTKAEEPEELEKGGIPNQKKIVERENPDSEAGEKNISSNLIEKIKNIWPQIIKQLEEKRMYLACCLSKAKAIGLEEGSLRLKVESESNFQFQILEEKENKRLVEKLVSERLGQEIKLKYEKSNPELSSLPRRSRLQEMLRNPKLKKISHMLNAKVLKVIPEDER